MILFFLRHVCLLLVLACGLLSAGCGSSPPDATPTAAVTAAPSLVPAPTRAPSLPAPTAAPTADSALATPAPLATRVIARATTASAEVIAILERSGGLTRYNQSFIVKHDGTIETASGVIRVPGGREAAMRLAQQIAASEIFTVAPGEYIPANACCDRKVYELTLLKDGKSYTYATIDFAPNAPKPLLNILALLDDYIDSAN